LVRPRKGPRKKGWGEGGGGTVRSQVGIKKGGALTTCPAAGKGEAKKTASTQWGGKWRKGST